MKYLYIFWFNLFFILFSITIEAKVFTYTQVHKMPLSIEKDYYIWRFLSQATTTANEAKKIIYEVTRLNKKLRKAYIRRTAESPPYIRGKVIATPRHIWTRRSRGRKYFKQGLYLLKNGDKKLASRYFYTAYKEYTKSYDRDKSLFWVYMCTKDIAYLKRLSHSSSPNMYTLLAADALKSKYPETITERFRRQRTKNFDIQNPIDWAKVKAKLRRCNYNEIDKLAGNYASQECLGIYTYIKAKSYANKKAYFPLPYRDVMKKLNPKRQALIYAIARQESRFVPASVSRSFALGMMQFMPFLVKHIAKEKGYKMDLDEMFNPYRAIEFADYHLDYLNSMLYHPLFVAYAYNAGIGFTRHYLRNKRHFRKGPYEPYMSMEMMKNSEAREYGKKVLSNYVIYLNKLGVPTRITPLIMQLATPSKTDRVRR